MFPDCFFSIEFQKHSECEHSFDYVPFVYFTDYLLPGFVLLPSGISGKMTISLDTTTIIAMLVVLLLSLCLATYHSYHLYVKPPKLP